MNNDNSSGSNSSTDSENGYINGGRIENKENMGFTSPFEPNQLALQPLAQSTPLRPHNAARMNAHPYHQPNRGRKSVANSSSEDSAESAKFVDIPKNALLNVPDWEIPFAEVVGRMSILGSNRYVVTLAEMKRRLNRPEMLNQSVLSSFLRKAKNKEGGDNLSKNLAKYGLSIQQGRRKCTTTTSFTSLCEAEAAHFIKDFRDVTVQHFPAKDFAYEALAEVKSLEEMMQKKDAFMLTQGAISDILSVLARDVSPVCEQPTNIPSTMNPQCQEEFNRYSSLTHGFGMAAHKVAWEALSHTLNHCHRAFTDPKGFLDDISRPPPQSLNAIDAKKEAPALQQMQMMAAAAMMGMPNMGLPGMMNPAMGMPGMPGMNMPNMDFLKMANMNKPDVPKKE